jgi:hypothetical protein
MTKDELRKEVELELQWLRYYSYGPSKENLDMNRSLYEQLVPIGYAKKNIELHKRCAFFRVTSMYRINRLIKLEQLVETELYRDDINNIFTALEVWMLMYPEDNDWVLKQLK